jgi:phage FluMu protein Com
MAGRELRFQATCPRCGELAAFLAVKIEKAVLTQAQLAEGERPGFRGFRCLLCRKVIAEAEDVDGYGHRWEGDRPVAFRAQGRLPERR